VFGDALCADRRGGVYVIDEVASVSPYSSLLISTPVTTWRNPASPARGPVASERMSGLWKVNCSARCLTAAGTSPRNLASW
jgi:hypothetical protein